jgi:hypothetical protein
MKYGILECCNNGNGKMECWGNGKKVKVSNQKKVENF